MDVGIGTVTVIDMEKYSVPKGLTIDEFPLDKCPRLVQFTKMYARYCINRITIKACGLVGSASSGTIVYGVMSGPSDTNVKDPSVLKPSKAHHSSKTSQITIGRNIQVQQFMLTSGANDNVPFTLYSNSTNDNNVIFEIHYNITFSSPLPFSANPKSTPTMSPTITWRSSDSEDDEVFHECT